MSTYMFFCPFPLSNAEKWLFTSASTAATSHTHLITTTSTLLPIEVKCSTSFTHQKTFSDTRKHHIYTLVPLNDIFSYISLPQRLLSTTLREFHLAEIATEPTATMDAYSLSVHSPTQKKTARIYQDLTSSVHYRHTGFGDDRRFDKLDIMGSLNKACGRLSGS